ncbi:hypothetical protein SDJN03_29520, partial [Cucurbita argyrosperma subsp. sororia]
MALWDSLCFGGDGDSTVFTANGTSQKGPPATMAASLAVAVRMSEQETVLGHFLSSSTLMSSITENPHRVLLTKALLSLLPWFNRIDNTTLDQLKL